MGPLDIIVKYYDGLLAGLGVTLSLSGIIWLTGIVGGTIFGFLGARLSIAATTGRILSFLLAGVPVIVVLFWLHYPAQAMIGVVLDPFYTAAVALSLINVVSVADVVRSALTSFPRQYTTIAHVCGLTSFETVRYIQIPLLLRQLTPPLLMIQVNMLQATLFASLISVEELFRVAQRINSIEYRPIEVYSALAIFYLLICLPMNGIAIWLKKRYSSDFSVR